MDKQGLVLHGKNKLILVMEEKPKKITTRQPAGLLFIEKCLDFESKVETFYNPTIKKF